ncbi:MAG TPA: two-component regulator propeller domain-containing protein [Candidatus Rifleibacterium sp.]|nr:two-component regulator propeller domain-containing protein [Candidatus Rifleibacterium sp.]HPT44485.1 two-component regulator propeller domain-containing protein [Candidatus Rifleibacterium sp.]
MLQKLLVLLALLGMASISAQAEQLSAPASTIRSIAFDNQQRMWVGTFGLGLWLKDGQGLRPFTDQAAKQPFPMINNLLISGRDLYIATAGGGCVRLDTETLRFAAIEQATGFEKLHALMETGSGSIFIGSVGSGTANLQNNRWQPMTVQESSQLAWVNSIVEWQGYLWLGTATGLYRNPIGHPWKPESYELRRPVNCLLVHENILYAGSTDRGVFSIKPGDYPEQIPGTLGPINMLVTFAGKVIAGGKFGLWVIQKNGCEELKTVIDDPRCAGIDAKKILHIGTVDGKIYQTADLKKFIHAYSISNKGLKEQGK